MYQLCEKVEIGENRLEIADLEMQNITVFRFDGVFDFLHPAADIGDFRFGSVTRIFQRKMLSR